MARHVTRIVPALVAALAVAGAVAVGPHASPSAPRLFVSGESLGDARLGMTKEQIVAVWGREHGVCRDCRRTTWYYNERPFQPEGTGVVFARGRAVQLLTVWKPTGWKTAEGLRLGSAGGDVGGMYGEFKTRRCRAYQALVITRAGVASAFYVYNGDVWGFGLMRADLDPCL